ncbi:MAG: signal peptidase II, partial [Firmicutes bacterium CAG:272_52_7]
MQLILWAAIVVISVALDQISKYIVVLKLKPVGTADFINGILGFSYVENTGAAFSILEAHTWLLALVSLVMSALLAWALFKPLFRHPLGRFFLALVLAGAVGNLIDRALRGFVVDMFNVLFMNFAVFNVADICVVVGGI